MRSSELHHLHQAFNLISYQSALCPFQVNTSRYVCVYKIQFFYIWDLIFFHWHCTSLASSTLHLSIRGNGISLGWLPSVLQTGWHPWHVPMHVLLPFPTVHPANMYWAWSCYVSERDNSEGNRQKSRPSLHLELLVYCLCFLLVAASWGQRTQLYCLLFISQHIAVSLECCSRRLANFCQMEEEYTRSWRFNGADHIWNLEAFKYLGW